MDLERAYAEVGPKIVAYLVATGTGEAGALDLLHDAVLRVARKMEEGALREGNLGALLFTTARNLRANAVRDNGRISLVESPEAFDTQSTGPAAAGAALDAMYLRGRIAAALATLPEATREAYCLYHLGGRSLAEVAALTGASANLVKVRLYRARAALRRELKDIKEK